MTRKRCHRRVTVPLPPRGLRPRLDRGQLTDLALAHLTNLDALAHGRADNTTLWHAVEAAFTWSRVAQLLGIGEAEMAQQLALLEGVLARYKRSGRIGLSGPEYQLAKTGVDVMDELARLVDVPTAVAAAAWSEARIDRQARSKEETEVNDEPRDEYRTFLLEQLALLRRSHEMAARPIIDELVKLYALEPPPPIYIDLAALPPEQRKFIESLEMKPE